VRRHGRAVECDAMSRPERLFRDAKPYTTETVTSVAT
jgi:hypothetical protein